MPFIVDDAFYDFAREHKLPDCAVSFLMRAGSWSARNSRSGFVPASMLPDFSSDPDQAERTLRSAGILRRVKAGLRIIEGRGVAVVDAKDVHRDNERKEAAAEGRRAKWRDDKQRQRDAEKAERHRRITDSFPAVSAEENVDVHRENPGVPRKPQVAGVDVQVDIARTSTRTTKKTASDQDQSQSPGVNRSDPRGREVPSPETLALVVAGISKKLKRIVTEAEACRAIAEWDRRAEAADNAVHDPVKFYPACIRRERDLGAIIAPTLPVPPPSWLELGTAPDPPPGAHAYQPDPSPFIDECAHPGCGLKEKNARHVKQEAGAG